MEASPDGCFTGCIKAFVPLTREQLTVIPSANPCQNSYQRGKVTVLKEKRIFGALTNDQVGYISNVSVNFADEGEVINKDTYVYRTMDPADGLVKVDVEEELYKINAVNEFTLSPLDLTD